MLHRAKGGNSNFRAEKGGVWGSRVRVKETGVYCQAEEADRGPLRENGGFEDSWSVCEK